MHLTTNVPNEPLIPPPIQPQASLASRLVFAEPGATTYTAAFSLSAAQYKQHFNCQLRETYPAYFCLMRRDRVIAACGIRSSSETLFLQQYLDAPVTAMLSDRIGRSVMPEQLVELGGFSVSKRGLALPFMAALVPALGAQGFTHAVATATLPVRRCLKNLGIPTVNLGSAAVTNLVQPTSDWGRYYDMRPAVVAGSIVDAGLALTGGAAQ